MLSWKILKKRKLMSTFKLLLKLSILGFIAVFCIFPFYWMIVKSLTKTFTYTLGDLIPSNPILTNYVNLFKYKPVLSWVVNSFVFSSVLTLCTLILSLAAAFALSRHKFPGRETFFFMILSTMFIPFFVILIPSFLMFARIGWVDTFQALVIPVVVSGFDTLLARQYMLNIPKDIYDSAYIDGCSEIQIFLKIVLPLSKTVIALIIAFTFLWSWNLFLWPLIILYSDGKFPLTLGLSTLRGTGLLVTDVGVVFAATTISFLPPLVLFIILQKYLIQAALLTGIKR